MVTSSALLPALLAALRLLPTCYAYEPVKNLPACTKTPPSSEFICGLKGRVKPGQGQQSQKIFTYSNVSSVAACHLECLPQEEFVPEQEISLPSCYSVGYDAQAQTCSGFRKTAKQLSFTQDVKSTMTFYDSQCFMCIYDTPPPQGSNLLANGGFQKPTSSHTPYSPWLDSSNSLTVVSPGFRSTKALQNKASTNSIFVTQALIDPVRGYYDYSFDYKFQAFDPTPFPLHPSTSDGLNQHPIDMRLYQPAAVNNNTWSSFKGTMEMGPFENATGQPWYERIIRAAIDTGRIDGGNSDVKLLFDNVKITPAQLPFQTKPGAPNLIPNGGFESKSLKGFKLTYHGPNENGTQNKSFSFVRSGASGSKYALQLDPSKLKLGIAGYYFEISQNTPLKDDVEYIAGMTYRVVKGNPTCAANLTTNKIYDLYMTLDDTTGTKNTQIGTYFQFRVNSFDNAQYETYQFPVPTFSSYTQRNNTKVTFRFGQCCGDTAPGCPLQVDEIFIREKA